MNENKSNINWEITTYGKLLYKKKIYVIINYERVYENGGNMLEKIKMSCD